MLDDLVKSLSEYFISDSGSDCNWVGGVSLTQGKRIDVYIAVMCHVREHIRRHGLESAILGPEIFLVSNISDGRKRRLLSGP